LSHLGYPVGSGGPENDVCTPEGRAAARPWSLRDHVPASLRGRRSDPVPGDSSARRGPGRSPAMQIEAGGTGVRGETGREFAPARPTVGRIRSGSGWKILLPRVGTPRESPGLQVWVLGDRGRRTGSPFGQMMLCLVWAELGKRECAVPVRHAVKSPGAPSTLFIFLDRSSHFLAATLETHGGTCGHKRHFANCL